jgi:tetratricopeptide (TPR) repeat protein
VSDDQHPEELIDRALAGGLTAPDRRLLAPHLAICRACAAQLAWAPAFQQQIAAQPRDEVMDRRAVEAALARVEASARRWRPMPIWMRAAAAGLLLLVGAASFALIGHRDRSPRASLAPQAAPPATPAARARPPIGPLKTADDDQPPAPAPALLPPAAAPAEAPHPPARRSLAPRPAATATAPGVKPTAAALFSHAAQLRREGRSDDAIAIYHHLQRGYPTASETQVSFALAGQLDLEAGRMAQALRQFDRYLGAGRVVDEEALAGRATALEGLGRSGAAAAAWRDLLRRHPESVYAERARAHLAATVPSQGAAPRGSAGGDDHP